MGNNMYSAINNIKEYLDKLKELKGCVLIFAIRDTAGYWFDQELQDKMQELGFHQNLVKTFMVGYIGIKCNDEIIFESSVEKDKSQYYSGLVENSKIEIVSKPFLSGDVASIKIDGVDYAVNSRGINIVIYDYQNQQVIDSVSFDTHVKEFTYKRNNQIVLGKKHYDIALVGCWWGANYGSVLNGYAVYKILKSLDLSVLMVHKHNAVKNDWEITNTHNARFIKSFYPKEEVSPVMSYKHLAQLNQYCDTFLVGSDQIWNYGINKLFNMAFMLNFVSNKKRKLSFGTSFGHGHDGAPKDQLLYIKKLLSRFNAISVREKSGAEICKDTYNVRATVVVEPVFCLDVEQYIELANHSKIVETEPYILTYILDPTPHKREIIQYYSKLSGLKAINILDGDPRVYERNKEILDLPNTMGKIGAEDVMKLYQNASFIISDSFHGTAFSIIFNKPFLSIVNFRRGMVRFGELLGKFNLLERLANDPENIPKDAKYMEKIDYTTINDLIKQERERSIDWLKKSIETPLDKMQAVSILPKAIESVRETRKCTGCGCCKNVCPVQAIEMKTNKEGFLVPYIKEEKCIECGLCEKRCSVINPQYKNESKPKCFAVMAQNDVRKKSSSGGMFTIAAEYVIANGGYVAGAVYREDFSVEHIVTNNLDMLDQMRGSKYIQSDCTNVYREVRELLEKEKMVLFTGMPCQVAGLYSYLGREYGTLITMDLLCHGITSYKVFDKYHKDVLENKPLKELYFKAKEPWGWHAGVNAYFLDGTHYAKPLESDWYYIAYLSSISKNIACGVCKSNKLPRQGDLTIGDFWGVAKYKKELNDQRGTSVVLLNNKKAETFFDKLKPLMQMWEEAPLSVAIQGNQIIKGPYALHKNRELFFKYFQDVPFDVLTHGCKNNRVYEQYSAYLNKKVPPEEQEFYYLAKIVAEHCKGRKIVTWIRSPRFEKVLEDQFHLSVAFGVSMRKEAVNNRTVRYFYDLRGKSREYYLVSLDRAYSADIYKQLNEFGYEEIADFVFRMPKPIVIENYDCSKNSYFDLYGNTIEGFSGIIKKIVLKGANNHITLGKGIKGTENLEFSLCANSVISIGAGCNFRELNKFQCLEHNGACTIDIGKNCRFGNSIFRVFEQGLNLSIIINEACTFENNLEIRANQGKSIVIGKDCMFSYNICMMSGDGHCIFDVKRGINVNSVHKHISDSKKQLVIGEHVWVGYGAFILHGTNIGDGSIVGAKSVVKGHFPNNSVITGNPAIMAKSDMAWSRDGITDGITHCGQYAKLTSQANSAICGKNVLVIGGTRFMGVFLVNELINRGNHVTIATRGKTRDEFGHRVQRVIMDVSNPDSVKYALADKYFDVIFDNLAYCSNFVKNILDNVRCKKYIQLSSVAIYRNKKLDLKEEDFDPKINPLKWSGLEEGYFIGKRQAETAAYQYSELCQVLTVRIPYVTNTERLYYYCKNIVKQIPMKISDVNSGFTFVRASEVGKFLPWIAAQNYVGPINLASTGVITIRMVLDYIEKKVGKKAILDNQKGIESPFNEKTFSMSMEKAQRLGYYTSDINEWFWNLMDSYIARALREEK